MHRPTRALPLPATPSSAEVSTVGISKELRLAAFGLSALVIAPTAQAQQTSDGSQAHVKLQGNSLSFYRKQTSGYASGGSVRLKSGYYERMCSAPCDVVLPTGTQQLAISSDGDPVETNAVEITGDGSLEADYESRQGTRTLGVVIAVVGSVIGASILSYGVTKDEGGLPFTLGGVGTMVGSMLAGMLLVLSTPDEANVRFIPSAPSPPERHADTGGADTASLNLVYTPGLQLSVAF
ncbi:MAG: hypothetical protein KC492_07150 [Myxococcales bacterium]|nr:hypothetical protein [Myxococcales bacterium]